MVHRELENGGKVMVVCEGVVNSQALKGLREARKGIAANPEIPAETRRMILRQLDSQIQRFSGKTKLSYTFTVPAAWPARAVASSGRNASGRPVQKHSTSQPARTAPAGSRPFCRAG